MQPESYVSRTITSQNYSSKQKLISVIFIVFDNFFKVALVYVSLLWWNINAILKISIENFMEYPKHSKIQFYYRYPNTLFWKVARMKKKQWLIWISLCSQQSSWVGRKLTLYVWNWLLRHQVDAAFQFFWWKHSYIFPYIISEFINCTTLIRCEAWLWQSGTNLLTAAWL